MRVNVPDIPVPLNPPITILLHGARRLERPYMLLLNRNMCVAWLYNWKTSGIISYCSDISFVFFILSFSECIRTPLPHTLTNARTHVRKHATDAHARTKRRTHARVYIERFLSKYKIFIRRYFLTYFMRKMSYKHIS